MNIKIANEFIKILEDDLNSNNESKLVDDICRVEKILGDDIPKIVECKEEIESNCKLLRRNAYAIVALIKSSLGKQFILGFDISQYEIKDMHFNKLIEQSFVFYKNGNLDIATEKVWDAFERIKTLYNSDKKKSVNELINVVCKNDKNYKILIETEFKTLTKIGNEYKIRHHEKNKKNIDNNYLEYLFFRCLSVLKLCVKENMNEI